MVRGMWIIASIFGLTAVIFGAIGSHALKELIPSTSLTAWQTAVNYQMFHALVILILTFEFRQRPSKSLSYAGMLFTIGVLLFSGSIYLLSTKVLHFGQGILWLGPITPIGGICFIFGWLCLAMHAKNIKYE